MTKYLTNKDKKIDLENYLVHALERDFNTQDDTGLKVVGVDIKAIYGDMPKTYLQVTLCAKVHNETNNAIDETFLTKTVVLNRDLTVVETPGTTDNPDSIKKCISDSLETFKIINR